MIQHLERANAALDKLARQAVRGVDDIARQEEDYEAAQAALAPYKEIGNLIVARKMGLKIADSEVGAIVAALESGERGTLTEKQTQMLKQAETVLGQQEPIHWELDFTTVLKPRFADGSWDNDGFDTMIGNPPFIGGKKISTGTGQTIHRIPQGSFPPSANTTDLCAYFFRQAFDLIKKGGDSG